MLNATADIFGGLLPLEGGVIFNTTGQASVLQNDSALPLHTSPMLAELVSGPANGTLNPLWSGPGGASPVYLSPDGAFSYNAPATAPFTTGADSFTYRFSQLASDGVTVDYSDTVTVTLHYSGATAPSSAVLNEAPSAWAQFQHDAAHTGSSSNGVVVDNYRALINTMIGIEGSIVLLNSGPNTPTNAVAYIDDGTLHKFNLLTNTEAWSYPLGAGSTATGQAPSLGVVDGVPVLFVNTTNTHVLCINANTGAPLWTRSIAYGTASPLIISATAPLGAMPNPNGFHGEVVVGSWEGGLGAYSSGSLRALNPDGSNKWAVALPGHINHAPVYDATSQTIFVVCDPGIASGTGYVYAVDAFTGAVRAAASLYVGNSTLPTATPSLSGGSNPTLYVPAMYNVYRFTLGTDSVTGQPLLSPNSPIALTTQIHTSVSISNNGSFGFGDDAGVFRYYDASGALLWERSMGGSIQNSAIISNSGGFLSFGVNSANDSSYYVLDLATGDILSQISPVSGATPNAGHVGFQRGSAAMDENGNIYIGCTDGTLFIFFLDSKGGIKNTVP